MLGLDKIVDSVERMFLRLDENMQKLVSRLDETNQLLREIRDAQKKAKR